jgi:pentatricopeptide repeat protein
MNVQTYSAAIDMFAKMSDTESAVKLFKEMRGNKVQPNFITYNSLMEAFIKAGYPTAALSIFEEIRRASPNGKLQETSYMWKIKCFTELGDLQVGFSGQ